MEVREASEKRKGHTLRNILLFIIFLGIGIAVGYFGTLKYLEYKENGENPDDEIVESGPKDITNDEQNKDLITSLYAIIDGDYTSKLKIVYKSLVADKVGSEETLNSAWWGAPTCDYGFLVVDSGDPYNPSNRCSVTRIKRSEFMDANKKIFNDEILDTSVSFNPQEGKYCIVDPNNNETYLCGNVANTSGVTGSLESKFTIQKVTKDENGTIEIYEKGYLVDKRSNVGTEYDNYYLHSSDSKNYYYELKSADNLTFKHIFKTNDKINYYYTGTELVK